MNSGIYQILNIITNKFYIGSAVDLTLRWSQHKHDLKNNNHGNTILQRSYNKYGASAFEFILIELAEPEKLLEREQYWIDSLDACDRSVGYNRRLIAHSNLGMKWTDDHKFKISQSKRGTIQPQSAVDARNAANRKTHKWPHLSGCRCKCDECRIKKNLQNLQYIRKK